MSEVKKPSKSRESKFVRVPNSLDPKLQTIMKHLKIDDDDTRVSRSHAVRYAIVCCARQLAKTSATA